MTICSSVKCRTADSFVIVGKGGMFAGLPVLVLNYFQACDLQCAILADREMYGVAQREMHGVCGILRRCCLHGKCRQRGQNPQDRNDDEAVRRRLTGENLE